MKTVLFSLFLLFLMSVLFASGQIDIAYSPYTISQPGSYIVVKDLHTLQDVDCITIETSNVTLDLNGHTLYGGGTTVGSTGRGVYAGSSTQFNISVRNGVVRDFRDSGIYLYSLTNQVTQIRAYGNGNMGIYGYHGSMVKENTVNANSGIGISVGYGSTVTGNTAFKNGNHGIFASVGSTVTGNTSIYNTVDGINASHGSTVEGNTAYSNTRNGITLGSGCTVMGNSAYSNDSCGILVSNGGFVTHNTCRANSFAGIQVMGSDNSICQNVCSTNTLYGLWCGAASYSYFEQNKLRSNGTNQSLGGGTEGTGSLANVIIP